MLNIWMLVKCFICMHLTDIFAPTFQLFINLDWAEHSPDVQSCGDPTSEGNRGEQRRRIVNIKLHLWLFCWPIHDHSIPIISIPINEYMYNVQNVQFQSSYPLTVECSAHSSASKASNAIRMKCSLWLWLKLHQIDWSLCTLYKMLYKVICWCGREVDGLLGSWSSIICFESFLYTGTILIYKAACVWVSECVSVSTRSFSPGD